MHSKRLFFILALLLPASVSFAQNSWMDLKNPQSNIIGRPIVKPNNGDPTFVPDRGVPDSLKLIVNDGPDFRSDYKQKAFNFIVSVIKAKSVRLDSVVINKIKVVSIHPDNFRDGVFEVGSKFAFEGLTADSLTIVFRRKRGIEINRLDSLLGLFIPNMSNPVSKLLSSVDINIGDSVSTRIIIKNPNVYFKVRFIQYLEGLPRALISNHRTWDDYWVHFYENNTALVSPTTKLLANGNAKQRQSKMKFPQFWGEKNDDPQRLYYFEVTKVNNELHLYFKLQQPHLNPKILVEIPAIPDSNPKTWELPYQLVDNFKGKSDPLRTKFVFLACQARQIDPNTIVLDNYDQQVDNKETILTYMKYPEIKFRYL